MATKVMYNSGAQLSLGELNKNINKAGKALARASKGERLVDAGDGDSSAYAISERMREKIRSLLQDDQNVQNGSAMLRIAERGIDQIVEELRTLKELAIDAANDSNTDEDRRTMQKEFDSRTATIDEIALGTNYNGKILLDGRWSRGGAAPLLGGVGGGKNTKITNMFGSFSAGSNATTATNLQNGAGSVGTYNPSTGTTTYTPSPWSFTGDIGFRESSYSGGRFAANLDFSSMQTTDPYPDTLHGQGFTILCSGCAQYINIRFDASTTKSMLDTRANIINGVTNNQARDYVIGVKDVKSADDLAEAIFQGISSVQGGNNNEALVDRNHNVKIERDGSGNIVISKDPGLALIFKEGTIPNPLTDPIEPVETKEKPWNPLWVQHGTQSGQRFHVYINSMQIKDLGLDGAGVTTRDRALSAISSIDNAISTALDEATNLGAWLNRLEYTGSNITTMSDNVQNSESTIRDADMAKQITEYTKYNILTQSAQSMLAQANQNGSSILSLLQ